LREDNQFIIGIEGVILNLKSLKELNGKDNVFEVIKSLYFSKGENFINDLRGDFSGFIYSKSDDSWLVFTNQTGSKRLFYFENQDYFIFASELRDISFLLHQLNIPVKPDIRAAYSLLTYGFMLKNITLVSNVLRLTAGTKLNFKENKLAVSEYFNLRNIQKTTDSKEQIIEKVDELFCKAVQLEFEKDKEYNYKHIATLSGGLDSRMTVLVADKLGYKEQLNFTFSQSNYLDELISKQIASDYKHEFLFQSLDNGNFLKEIDKTVYINDGLILYSGACHLLNSLEKINFATYGLVHTGQIGDAVLGSFLSKPYSIKPVYSQGAYSGKLLAKIESFSKEYCEEFENEELYKFYSRAFAGALNGNLYMDIFTQTVSPFLDVDFLSYCYSIPDSLKYKHKIYLEWIAKKYPEFGRYRWEKTGVSPLKSTNWKKYLDWNYYMRMKLKFFDKKSKKMRTGMNPFDEWMEKNPELSEFVYTYYNSNILNLTDYKELKLDCEKLFNEGNLNEKLQVLTLLSAYKLHFYC
jgi:asparagine synthase (glutamine-hydrolysing)